MFAFDLSGLDAESASADYQLSLPFEDASASPLTDATTAPDVGVALSVAASISGGLQVTPEVLHTVRASVGTVALLTSTSWHGVTGLDVHLRQSPDRQRPSTGVLRAGTPVRVVRWVSGEEVEPYNDTWAELADGAYVYSTALRRAGGSTPPVCPPGAPREGRWIDINLTEQVATAYDGQLVVRSVLVSSGRPGRETPQGTFPVLRRIERDSMDSAVLVGRRLDGAEAGRRVEDVRYVQYYTPDGAAIHENYWRRPATFGMPGSRGCIGMAPADAAWFWEFATIGTPIVVHV